MQQQPLKEVQNLTGGNMHLLTFICIGFAVLALGMAYPGLKSELEDLEKKLVEFEENYDEGQSDQGEGGEGEGNGGDGGGDGSSIEKDVRGARIAVKTLTVSNGGEFGTWGREQYCADGSYAVGYNMKIEARQGSGDDTSLNGIEIICKRPDEKCHVGTARASDGPWGEWVGQTSCGKRYGKQGFLTAFRLQVEQWRSSNDDTSANYVGFKCRDFEGTIESYELFKYPGHGFWGSYGHWSSECGLGTAICGIQTKVEAPQGGGDDTALNDVKFKCCS